MRLPNLPFVVLDTETTGFIPRVNRVIEFAAVRFENGKETAVIDELVTVPEDPPLVVQTLTHIRAEDLRGKRPFIDLLSQIKNLLPLGTLIVGQNVSFDLRMLKGEGLDLSEYPWIDTSMLASMVFPELRSFSLGYVSSVLGLNHEPVHRALGDVRATLELFEKCFERLGELPPARQKELQEAFARSSEGYRLLAEVLPKPEGKRNPAWMVRPPHRKAGSLAFPTTAPVLPDRSEKGTPNIVEHPLSPEFLQSIVDASTQDSLTVQWIAVKNLEASLRRLTLPEGVRVITPPRLLLNTTQAEKFLTQDRFTADEATLATKLQWFSPKTQGDLPLHGEERSIWQGVLAATEESDEYRAQFTDLPSVVLIDHRQLLLLVSSETHPGHAALTENAHLIIDDASMLEESATKAHRWFCAIDSLRAAAEGDKDLTSFTDLLQLWIERVRAFQDVRYLVKADLESPEVRGLLERLKLLVGHERAAAAKAIIDDLQRILLAENLPHRITWIEQRQNGSQFIESVPERVGELLQTKLFDLVPTTLLLPPGMSALPEILAPGSRHAVKKTPSPPLPLVLSTDVTLEEVFQNLDPGKTILLLGSRRLIEECFVRWTAPLEERGISLICQNLSGGLERMQAEFLAAPAPAVWVLTPWTFEEVELPAQSVDRLLIASLPFDHPSHTVLSRRAQRYRDAFREYFLPRLLSRLFRLLLVFTRHRTTAGEVRLLDPRLQTKEYGKEIAAYLRMVTKAGEAGEKQMKLF